MVTTDIDALAYAARAWVAEWGRSGGQRLGYGVAGQELRVSESSLQPLAPGQYYEHELTGCVVETVGGDEVGIVGRVESGVGGSRLVVEGARGEVLIPLAEYICREIDTTTRRIRIDPPDGLLELNESKRSRR